LDEPKNTRATVEKTKPSEKPTPKIKKHNADNAGNPTVSIKNRHHQNHQARSKLPHYPDRYIHQQHDAQ
jgi:hypothetical protein